MDAPLVDTEEPDAIERSAAHSRLWTAWRERSDEAAREQLLAMHLEFARIIAGRLYARRTTDEIDFDEYLQLASVGLIESVDRYDPALGASFRTYASHRIQGAILSGLEALTERQRQLALKRRLAKERLEAIDAAKEGSEDDAFARLASIAVGLALGFMLDDLGMYQAGEGAYGDNTYAAEEARQLRTRLAKLVGELPEREARIIRHHYLQQIPFDEIAESMGLTKGRVSQLHGRALRMLRELLQGPGSVDARL